MALSLIPDLFVCLSCVCDCFACMTYVYTLPEEVTREHQILELELWSCKPRVDPRTQN